MKRNPLRRLASFGQSIWLDGHGAPEASLERDVEAGHRVLEALQRLGLGLDEVTRRLEDEGIEKFNKAYDKLIESLGTQTAAQSRTAR